MRERTIEEKEIAEADFQKKLKERGGYSALGRQSTVIETYWHVIHNNDEGRLSQAEVEASIEVLNQDFEDSGSEFSFALKDITYTDNPTWFGVADEDDYFDMSQALHVGDCATANIYSNGMSENLGFVNYFPDETDESCQESYIDDGIWILHTTIPGGTDEVYNEGKTLVHEVGHWMGLYHTFAGGCDGEGDLVADTPPEAEANYGCPSTPPDTCPGGGADPINNYMDYSHDTCLTEFTPGQVDRMTAQFTLYRADGKGGGGDDNTSSGLCFSPHATAVVEDKGIVTMRDLAVGDNVLTASGQYQTVYTINHFHPNKPTTFLRISTDLVDDQLENALELSGMHLVYIQGKDHPVPAAEVQVGDSLQTLHYGPRVVVDIQLVTRNGLYNPITADGTMLVDGVLASSYTSFTGSAHLEIAGVKLISVHHILHMTIAPYQAFCMATLSLNICNQHGEDELPTVVELVRKFHDDFFSRQHAVVQFVILSIYLSIFGWMNVFLSKYSAFLTAALAVYVFCIRGADRNKSNLFRTKNRLQKTKHD